MKRSFNPRPLILVITSIIISSCTLPAYRVPYAPGYIERGIASWYGEDFHGRPTSSGEIYDMYQLTAAHREQPLGTWIMVTNLNNGRSEELRVNQPIQAYPPRG